MNDNNSSSIKVWDLPVRIFHWALVLAVSGAYLTHEAGIEYFKYHLWCGYAVVILVSFRVLWGVVGTYHARFWNFVRNPIHTLRYGVALLRNKETHYSGHNPLGAWMVIILLIALLAQGVTGLFGNDEILNFGPLYGYVSNDLSLKLTSIHRQLFDLLAAATAVHVLAVLFHLVIKKENLIRAMFTGRKPHSQVNSSLEIQSSRLWLAALLLLALCAALTWLVTHAPVSEPASFL